MKNIVIGILLLIIVLVAIGIVQQYGIIDWQWKQLAVAVAALAGPYQFVVNKLEAKKEEKEKKEREFQFKRLEYQQYRRRELSRTRMSHTSEPTEIEEVAPSNNNLNTEIESYG